MMKLFSLLTFTIFTASSVTGMPVLVLSQNAIGKNACGPCALVNSLLQSGDKPTLALLEGDTPHEKAIDFAARFGGVPSPLYKGLRTAYSAQHGTADVDLLAMVNSLREQKEAPKLVGEHLLMQEGEKSKGFTQRIYWKIRKSINAGFPPLLSVRSVEATRKKEAPLLWHGLSGHWLCIVDIVPAEDGVFTLKLADSITGKVITALMYNPHPRRCKVPLTFQVDDYGKEKWNWEDSDRCLFISCPSLTLGTQQAQWHERTFIAARYLITDQNLEGK